MNAIVSSSTILSRLMRWEDYSSYVQVILGYLLVKHFALSPSDWGYLLAVFIVFSPLLYGGLYTLNDVMDAKRDALNTIKKNRPIPEGKISRKQALLVSASLLVSAFVIAVLWGDWKVEFILLWFFALNIFYTTVAKHVPYLEFVFNTVTHPLRLFAGAWLAGGALPTGLYAVWFVAVFSGTVFRRIKEFTEGNEKSRPVMRFYTKRSLTILYGFGILFCLVSAVMTTGPVQGFSVMWVIFLSAVYAGYFNSSVIRRIIEFAWR